MANVALVVVVLLMSAAVISYLRRRGHGIVAKRGLSVGADLASLRDTPRVRVHAVTGDGANRVHLVLTPDKDADDAEHSASSDLDLVVALSEDDFGFQLLHEWNRSQSSLAIVQPPATHIVRLRSVSDLQPITLRRIDDG